MLAYEKKLDSDQNINIEQLWKIVYSKWVGSIVTSFALWAVEATNERYSSDNFKKFIYEYNKHIWVISHDARVDCNAPRNSILGMLERNLVKLQFWKSQQISEIMRGYRLNPIKVPDWGKMINNTLKQALERNKCLTFTKYEDKYYYAISGMDRDRNGTKCQVSANIENITQTNTGKIPIRCYIEDLVLYTTCDKKNLTYFQFKRSGVKNYDRMFSCSERKVMNKIMNNECELVSGWKPCFMCRNVKENNFDKVMLIGLSEWRDHEFDKEKYDRMAKSIIDNN